jgi:hypothetical protein
VQLAPVGELQLAQDRGGERLRVVGQLLEGCQQVS